MAALGRYEPYPNPGPKWEPEDWEAAGKLGWYVSLTDYCIRALPAHVKVDGGRLHWSRDEAAQAFVGALALKGHPLARRALEYVAMRLGVEDTARFIMEKDGSCT